MSKNIKQFSINDIQLFKADEDVDFMHVKIWALAEGNNSHRNPIGYEVLKRDANTILGKLIIAKFDKMFGDVTTHVPDQSIVGYIPPNQNIVFEEKDGKRFITVDGLVSKIYATDVAKMFRNGIGQREVSCEFSCNESTIEDEDGNKDILGFMIHGITILGLSYHASCSGAELKVMKFAKEFSGSDDLKKFAEQRNKELKLESHPMDKSKDALDTTDWDGDKAKHDLIKEKNYKTLAKSVCLLLEDGWEDRKVTALKYPVMNIKDGKWVYNEEGLSSALAYSAQHDEAVHKKVVAIQKKLGIYKEAEMAEDKKFSESEEKDVIMEKTSDEKETVVQAEEKDVVEEEKEMGCGEKALSEEDKEEIDKEEPKKFSLDSYVNVGALSVLLEKENESNKKLADKVMKEMSADEIVMEFVAITKELAELREFKANLEAEQKNKKLFSIMAQAKENLTTELFVKLYEEGKALAFAELDGFNNKVKAFVDEHKVTAVENDDIMTFASADNAQVNKEEIDVFEKIKRK